MSTEVVILTVKWWFKVKLSLPLVLIYVFTLWAKQLFSTHKDISPEWQESADGHVYSRVFVPGLCRDLPGDVASAAWRLEAAGSVLSHNAADDSEWKAHQHPGTQNEEHSGGRQSLSGAAPPVDRVNNTPCQEQRSCGNEGPNE